VAETEGGGAPARFVDSNVLLYLISGDDAKAARAEALLQEGGITISVQVLNEFANVARRKAAFTWSEVDAALQAIRQVADVVPVDMAVHERGLAIAQRWQTSIYDGMIVAAALNAGCGTLFSEDMQDGQLIDGMRIRNPFA
jgi:predicted nucleic acid-binding protein